MHISVNNKINEKVLIFYGLDAEFLLSYEYEAEENGLNLHEKYKHIGAGAFIGGEFNLLKWMTLRAGIKSYIFTISDYYFEEAEISYNANQKSFIQNTDISAGLSIIPDNSVEIEINTNFLNINFNNEERKQEYNNSLEEERKETVLTAEINFGIVIKIDHKNKKENTETEDVDNSNQ